MSEEAYLHTGRNGSKTESNSIADDFKPPPLIAFMAPIILVAMLAAGLSSVAMVVDPSLADIEVHFNLAFDAQLGESISVAVLILNDSDESYVIALRDHLSYSETIQPNPSIILNLDQESTDWRSYSIDITEEFGIKQISNLGVISLNQTGLPSPLRLDSLEMTDDPFERELGTFNADDRINIFDQFNDEGSNASIIERETGNGLCFQIEGSVDTTGDSHDFDGFEAEKPERVEVTPVEEEEGSEAETALLNAAIYVLIVLIGGFFILFLIRWGLANLLQGFFAFIIALACFSFGYYFIAVTFWFSLYHLQFVVRDVAEFLAKDTIFFGIVLLTTLLYALAGFVGIGMERFGQRVRNGLLISFGAGLGAFLGLHFPLWSTLLVLIALALYDIYAVFRGPIRGILEESDRQAQIMQKKIDEQIKEIKAQEELQYENHKLISAEDPDKKIKKAMTAEEVEYVSYSLIPGLPVYQSESITIGLGDFAFYSLLIGHSAMYGIIPLLFATLGILIGAYITFRFLERKKALPGLPISIFLGIIGFLSSILLFGSLT
ncbi:MAG: presenilin family intramembrane aspartyl protease [Candidatus Hodarchaeota archaeon]